MQSSLHAGFPVPPLSRQIIRATAIRARDVLQLPPGRINIPRLLDDLTRFGFYYDVVEGTSEYMAPGVEACYVPELRTIFIRDDVYDEMARGGQRAVFTVGHELGHALLLHRRTFNRQTVTQVPVYCQSEWQANTFSAEFTMPLPEIRQYRLASPEAIARYFGVSGAAATVRYADLKRRNEIN